MLKWLKHTSHNCSKILQEEERVTTYPSSRPKHHNKTYKYLHEIGFSLLKGYQFRLSFATKSYTTLKKHVVPVLQLSVEVGC